MAAYLLDTTAILAHFFDEPGNNEVQHILTDPDAEIFISTVSIVEFACRLVSLGFEAENSRERALAYARLATETVVPDTAVAVRAFELGTTASSRVRLIDTLIAASAMLTEAVLVHRDVHFEALSSVQQRKIGG